MNVIRWGAEKFTALCLKRRWIAPELQDWCKYVFEKWMGSLLFFLTVLVWMVLSGLYLETMAFLLPFYSLRRRVGGCHAKNNLSCFLISVSLVLGVTAFLSGWLMGLPSRVLVLMDTAAVVYLMVLRPAYPPQLNFSEREKKANNKRKRVLLIAISFFQLLSVPLFGARLLAPSLCGIVFTAATVNIQKIKIKGETENEKNRKSHGKNYQHRDQS